MASDTYLRRLKTLPLGISVNGAHVRNTYRLALGDVLSIHLSDPEEGRPKGKAAKLNILYEDEWLVIINKSAGIAVHSSTKEPDMDTVEDALYAYLPHDERPHPVSRLDRGTTGAMNYSPLDAFLGFIPGSFAETSTLAILLGGAILLFTGIASWRTMASVFVGGLAMGYLFQALGVTAYPAWWHLIVGGFAFGAVFMATDPVTSSQTNTGKYIVGLMTGALAVLIRVVNPAYPEGMMLSILFMNALAPLVDYYVVERNVARRKKRVKLAK